MIESVSLGLVCWLVTAIIVESELLRPLRAACGRWPRLSYLVGCNLCVGTWVGLGLAGLTPYRPLAATAPLLSWLLAGLLYKGVAHVLLCVTNHLRGE